MAPEYQGKSALPRAQIRFLDFKSLGAIKELEHFNTAGLAVQKFWSDKRIADVFYFGDKSGWKAARGEGEKAGWVKKIPVPKGFKVNGKAPRYANVKVFIEYLGPRIA